MDLIKSVTKAFSMLEPVLRRRYLALIPLAVFVAALEAAGVLLIFALLRLLHDPSTAAEIPFSGYLRAFFTAQSNAGFLAIYAFTVAIFYVVKNAVRLFETYVRESCASAATTSIARELLRRYLSAPYSFHLRRNSADLVRNTSITVDSICRNFMGSAVTAASEILVVIGVLAMLVISAPLATVLGSLVLATCAVLLLRSMQGRYSRWGRKSHDLSGTIQRNLQEAFRSIREIKLTGGSKQFLRAFAIPSFARARINALSGTAQSIPRLLLETLFVVGICAAAVWVLDDAGTAQEILPLLGLFAYALMRLLPSVHQIVYQINNCRFRSAAVDQIHQDWVSLEPSRSVDSVQRKPLGSFQTAIRFENVSYIYPGEGDPALSNIDLVIRRGESIGIMGRTGAGKTTLIDLLTGLLTPATGCVLVDGEDIRCDLSGWQAQIGYVSQQTYLRDDTLRRNIALGVDDGQIDDERVRNAIRTAQLDGFVSALPDGLDTIVGEAGSRLSGGERQRVAVARALYRDSEILVFDEAASALDKQTARALSSAVQELTGRKTIIIIAHATVSVRACDRLVLLRDGRIADTGSWDELTARSAEFRVLSGLPPTEKASPHDSVS